MRLVETNKKFTSDEEYFAFEEGSELKHELINGNLYEKSGASRYHNQIEGLIFVLLKSLLKTNGYEVYFEGFKVRTPEGDYFSIRMFVYAKAIRKNTLLKSLFFWWKFFQKQPVLTTFLISSSNTEKYQRCNIIYALNRNNNQLFFSLKTKPANGWQNHLPKMKVSSTFPYAISLFH